ncbi:MAG: beta-lactamase family protein [Planctomycetes bacterium]|nr:beta-lactamase family protein [Planctomycetota bacterium]
MNSVSLVRCVLVPLLALAVPAQAPNPDWLPAVDALAAEHLARPGAVGFSVGIARGGQVLLEKGYGLAEVEHRVPAAPWTRFRIGSVTKQFTAALVMRLCEQGKVALDDPLEKFVTDLPLQGKRVTVRMLLDHTSGIPSYTDLGEPWQKVWPIELSHAELLALVRDKPFDFEPGTDWHYNNTGYYLLGMLLERVHGEPFAAVVQREIAAPLALRHTLYDSQRDLIEDRAQGYGFENGKLCNDLHLGMSQPGAAGALLSTGGDLVRWSMALAAGKVVSAESYRRMTTPCVLPNGRNTGYGFGLILGEIEGRPAVHHGGGIFGFNSELLHVVGDDLHIAVVSNAEEVSAQKLAEAIVREVLAIPAFTPKDLPLPAELRDALVGDYELDLGMVLAVSVDGERLRAQGKAEGQAAFQLLWQGEREFRAAFDPSVKLVFAADAQSLTLHQGGGVFAGQRR